MCLLLCPSDKSIFCISVVHLCVSLALSPYSLASLCVRVCVCTNLHVCKKTSVLLCSTLRSYCKTLLAENDGNINTFVGEKCECIALVSSVHPFYGGNQMYVENKVVYIIVKGLSVIG